jgi:hypothetical protein
MMNNPDHEHTKQWEMRITQGLSQYSTMTFVKTLLGTETLDQLFFFFRDSPAINEHFDLQWDHKINYRPKHNKAFPVMPTALHTNPHRAHMVLQLKETIHNTVTAMIHHSILASSIRKYTFKHNVQNMDSKNNEQYILWQQWLWKGLTLTNTFEELTNIMGFPNLEDFITEMNCISFFNRNVES